MASGLTQPAAAAKNSILAPVSTLVGHGLLISSISYFPNGKQMISGSSDKSVRRWDLQEGEEIVEARDVCEQGVGAVAVSRDGRRVATADNSGGLKVRDVETGIMKIIQGHSRINCIDISADCTLLASGAEDSIVWIWSLDTCKLVAGPFKSADLVGALRFSQDSKKLAIKSDVARCLEVWNIQTQTLDARVGKYHRKNGSTAPVFWTTNDRTIIAAFSFTYDSPVMIYEFDASTLDTVGAPLKGHTDTIIGLALSSDCALLASASDDHTIKLWAFESRQLLASFHVMFSHHLMFSPDSRQLAYTTQYNTKIYLCNTPPDILQISALRNPPLSDILHSDGPVSVHRNNLTIDQARAQTPWETPRWIESWAIGHARIHRIQPTDIQGQHYEAGRQPLPHDLLHAHGPASDLPGTELQPVMALLHLPRRSSPTLSSLPPHFLTHPYEHPSSFSTDPFLPVRSIGSNDSHPEAMLHDLTGCISKDEDYPTARGGFGEIWKCTFHINRRSVKVAVKALQIYAADQLGAAKMKKMKRIKRELRICANLKHANILPVYGYTYGFGLFVAIVSPWAENGNLSDYLELVGAALTLVRRFQILRDIIAGLQYLHTNSVIHGDFSGSNVLIYGDGSACIADFGLSLMYSEIISASQASCTSTLKGNVRWMAPELLLLEQEDGPPPRPSEQSDIFSFGGIMLLVLTDKTPYYYIRNDPAIIWAMQKSEQPSRSRYPVLPEKYWQFIEQCWSTNPWDRPSTEGADEAIRNEFYSLSRS